ncbi:MAG TPA: CARDB domain-containing protein [Thermoplasmata archaeon]
MKGKAFMLLANRTLSALIVVSVLMSAFAGVLVMTNPGPAKAQSMGDLIVTGGTYTIEGIDQPVDGNVTVGAGGTLIVKDATLSVISNFDQVHRMTVEAGGQLILDHGKITTYLDQIDPWPSLDLEVRTGGKLTAGSNSVLQFPGSITVTGDTSVVTLNDTIVTALPTDLINQYIVGGVISADSVNDGPSITVTDASFNMFDSDILSLPEYPTDFDLAKNLTLAGSASLLAVDSYIDVDFGPATTVADWFVHNVISMTGTSSAELYGCSLAEYSGANADRAPAIVSNGKSDFALPLATKEPDDTTVGQQIVSLHASNEGSTYHVAPGQRMYIDTFDAGSAAAISSAKLLVRYAVNSGYNGNQYIMWNGASTGIRPLSSETTLVDKSFDLYAAGLRNTNELAALDISFLHSGTTAEVQFDSLSIVFTVGSEAHIYRWLNVIVGDEYGVPIPDASISAVFTGSSSFGGQPSFYFGDGGSEPIPPATVLEYMGLDTITFSVTGADGTAKIPYLTDLLSADQAPNSLYVGKFEITGMALVGTLYNSTATFSFPAYPAMDAEDQVFDFTVKLEGVSAESPDTTRWLVVPPDLIIANMTYYHAGDVIVAADGTLTLTHASFQLIQSAPNERVIYVDGTASSPGILHISDSLVTSALPIDLRVQGHGMLLVENSTLVGVNVVALDNARVVFKNVEMNGVISTDVQSDAVIEIYDSDLAQAPVLAGNSWGGFTDTSVPSISVQDDATAIIYRWIQVTVYDGAGYPVPGTNVSAKYFISGDLASWAYTDSNGIARVNSKGTEITSEGSSFVGNYRVSAKLTAWNAVEYTSDEELSIGVKPYSEPLGKNTTYALLHISTALPDLTLGADPIQFSPANPINGRTTYINVTVNNVGAVAAHNVVARYTDLTDNAGLGDSSTPVIEPGLVGGVVSLTWTANPPLDTEGAHIIQVHVDPDNTTPELVETQLIATKEVSVQSLPDLYVGSEDYEIYTYPADVVINTQVTLAARVYNIGDEASGQVQVDFYDTPTDLGERYLNSAILESVPIGYPGYVTATIQWTPDISGTHTIRVVAVHLGAAQEKSTVNNQGSNYVSVLDPPDVLIQSVGFTPVTGEIPGGDTLTVTVTLRNDQPAPISAVEVALYLGGATEPNRSALLDSDVVSTTMARGGTGVAVLYWETPEVTANTAVRLWIEANGNMVPVEQSFANNLVFRDITILDMRPDLAISSQNIKVLYGGTEITSTVFGRKVVISAEVENFGGQPAYGFNVTLGIKNATGWSHTFSDTEHDISAGLTNRTTNVTYQWTVDLNDPGAYQIWCDVDPVNAVSEQNEDDNYAEVDFTINTLIVKISATTDHDEYDAGDEMIITLTIRDNTTNAVVPNVPQVYVWLASTSALLVPVTPVETTVGNVTGKATVQMTIPLDIDTDEYRVVAEVFGQVKTSTGATVTISAQVEQPWLPMWLLLLIIVGIVGSVVGVTIYTYKYGLGKYVECGECGAFIPASNKRCPKCGVEFEAGTMKCSECGAWIPAESSECPNCGVKFVGEVTEEGDYLDRMRKQYEDQVVSKYRELAKPELGKKFSDEQFEAWWMQQPGYISFDDWLAKEEAKKKEGPLACPVCGTLNPKEATVCHKCGTVFATMREAQPPARRGPPPAAPPPGPATQAAPVEPTRQAPTQVTQALEATMPAAPKMVIRRPIDRKVVPKKIIKTPTGEEPKEGEGGGEEEQQ